MTSLGERQLGSIYHANYIMIVMDKDHEASASDRSEDDAGFINSDAESDLDSDCVSPSEESGDRD